MNRNFLYLFLYTDDSYNDYSDADLSYSEIKEKLLIPKWGEKTSSKFNHRALFNRLNIQILSSNDSFILEKINDKYRYNNCDDNQSILNDNNILIFGITGVIIIVVIIISVVVIKRKKKEKSDNDDDDSSRTEIENKNRKTFKRSPEKSYRVDSRRQTPNVSDNEEEEEEIVSITYLEKSRKATTPKHIFVSENIQNKEEEEGENKEENDDNVENKKLNNNKKIGKNNQNKNKSKSSSSVEGNENEKNDNKNKTNPSKEIKKGKKKSINNLTNQSSSVVTVKKSDKLETFKKEKDEKKGRKGKKGNDLKEKVVKEDIRIQTGKRGRSKANK